MTIKNIKYALQRAIRGYDKRIELGYGLEQHVINSMPGLKRFCERAIKQCSVSKDQINIFKKTIKLIDDYDEICSRSIDDFNPDDYDKAEEKMLKFVFKNYNRYWD